MGPVAAALLALLLLGYASVRSTVMQAVGMPSSGVASVSGETVMYGVPTPGMSDMAAQDATHPAGHQPAKTGKERAACPYCAVAANTALMGETIAPNISAFFVFVAFQPADSHGPRGPRAFESRARGPPVDLTPA
jgi:hypothetical protein